MKNYLIIGLFTAAVLSASVQAGVAVKNQPLPPSSPEGFSINFGPLVHTFAPVLQTLKHGADKVVNDAHTVVKDIKNLNVDETKKVGEIFTNLSSDQLEQIFQRLAIIQSSIKNQVKPSVQKLLASVSPEVIAQAKKELQGIAGFGMAGTPPIHNFKDLLDLANNLSNKVAELDQDKGFQIAIDKLPFAQKVDLYKKILVVQGIYKKVHDTVQNFVDKIPAPVREQIIKQISELGLAVLRSETGVAIPYDSSQGSILP
jgi:hypothetical protein